MASTSTARKRNRSEIGKQWWENKHQKAIQDSAQLKEAKKEANRLQKLNNTLSRLNSALLQEKAELKEAIAWGYEERADIARAIEENSEVIAWERKENAELNLAVSRAREENVALARERAELSVERDQLRAENLLLSESIKESAPFVKSLEEYGGFCKVTNKETLLAALGSAILAILSVVMRKTQPITRLRTISEVLFGKAIHGAAVTGKVLEELYQKYFFKENRELFAPWKGLRAIDTSSVGGLNYNGLETLRTCEALARYQRGILPS